MKFRTVCRLVLVFVAAIAAFSFDYGGEDLGSFVSEAQAAKRRGKKRYHRPRGRRAPSCVEFGRPAQCTGIKAKTGIFVVPQICQMLRSNRSCFATIGYRGCRTNSKIRGAARKSAHLCGKAVDIRLGTCNVGEFHGKGSARHRHYQQGSCP